MKRAFLYTRVSTRNQVEDGFSLSEQRSRLISYCKAHDYVIVGIYTDPGFSGSNLDRPGITNLIEDVKAKKADMVIVQKLDRLSRSQKDTLYLIEDVFLANEVDFVSISESFDTSSVYGMAMLSMLSVFAQLERENIKIRTHSGRIGRANDGWWHGGGVDPIGYDYEDGELIINEVEADQVRRVYELYASGHNLTMIAEKMAGCKTKHGDWSHVSTIGNVLDNPLYIGIVHFDGVIKRGNHKPIIKRDLYDAVQNRRTRLKKAIHAAKESRYLLTGIIHCSKCGGRYFALRRTNGNIFYSCYSRTKKTPKMIKDPSCQGRHWPRFDLEKLVIDEVMELASNPSAIHKLAEQKRAELIGDALPVEEVQKIDDEISRLMDLYQKEELLSVSEIAERIESLHQRKIKLMPHIEKEKPKKDFKIESARLLLRDLKESWDSIDITGKRQYLIQLIDKVVVFDDHIEIEWSFA